MPRPSPLVDRAMETQVALRDLRRVTVPLWEAAVASGNWTAMSEAKALAATLRSATLQCRRIAGLADGIACPDGFGLAGHGRAA